MFIVSFLISALLMCQTAMAAKWVMKKGTQSGADEAQSPTSNKALGISYYKKGMLEDAVEELIIASERTSGDAELHHYLGKAYYELDKLQDAIPEFLAAISLYSPDRVEEKAEAYSDLGLTYKYLKSFSESFSAYKESLALNPLKVDTNYYLGVLSYEKGRLNESATFLEKAVSLDSKDADAHFMLGVVYFKKNLPENAERGIQAGNQPKKR